MKHYDATEQAYKNGYEKGRADAKPTARAKWECDHANPNYSPFDGSPSMIYRCTNCGHKTGDRELTNYCPNCGADMKGDRR